MGAAQLVVGHADLYKRLPGCFRSIVTHLPHVVDLAHGTDQQRRRDGDRLLDSVCVQVD